jgi:phage tail-like protein
MKYPFKKFNYALIIDGITEARFSEISGIDATIEPVEYRVGDEGFNYARKFGGLTKYGNVTLKWGMTESMEFFEWLNQVSTGELLDEERNKNFSISLFDDNGQDELASWSFEHAWPTKYTGTDFNATASEVAIESVEIVFEHMVREK